MSPHPTHLSPRLLATAQRHLVAKAVAEFCHERLLHPQPLAPDRWLIASPAGDLEFAARVLPMEHWLVDESSLQGPLAEDVQGFVAAHADALGIPDDLLATYLEELASTLAAAMWKLAHPGPPSARLVDADHQTVEAAMTEGHPAFVANNGRIGLGLDDYTRYAPETGAGVRLGWVAARRRLAHLSLGAGVTEAELYADELGDELPVLRGRLVEAGEDPDDFLLLPVHPWQWQHKLAITFAPDLARRDLVWLGEGTQTYRAQQSIRTFANLDDPERHFVKTALSVQNMGFLRGLSPAYMVPTPAINDWVAGVVEGDPELAGRGFGVLRELAAIGYTGDAYHRLAPRGPHQKMIAALWRESAVPRLGAGERLATMAALLHRDVDGVAYATALIRASGLPASTWLRRYLDAYVRPIVHCLLAHDLVFMPHGENLILVLREHVPVRVVMKDLGEEVCVVTDRPLPADVERIRSVMPARTGALSVHTDVMDGFLRYLAAILDADGVLDAEAFWAEVADCVRRHAEDHPELAEAAARYDLFTSEFEHSCLNRLQLRNTLQMVDLTDQAASLQYAGTLANPLAARAAEPVGAAG